MVSDRFSIPIEKKIYLDFHKKQLHWLDFRKGHEVGGNIGKTRLDPSNSNCLVTESFLDHQATWPPSQQLDSKSLELNDNPQEEDQDIRVATH